LECVQIRTVLSHLLGAYHLQLILFFVASSVAEKGNNRASLPLLATYSLLSGYTLSGMVFLALKTRVWASRNWFCRSWCGITLAARQIGSNLSERDGMALSKTIGLGVIALLVVVLVNCC